MDPVGLDYDLAFNPVITQWNLNGGRQNNGADPAFLKRGTEDLDVICLQEITQADLVWLMTSRWYRPSRTQPRGESGVPHNARRAVGEPSGGQPTCELLVRREEQFAGRVECGLRPSANGEH